jgi:alcohol dehydrogenase (cytochrome c)
VGGGLFGVGTALDYKTGDIVWSHEYPSGSFANSGPGILTTAGKLLFTGDSAGNLIAFDPLRQSSSALPNGINGQQRLITYVLDGKQYLSQARVTHFRFCTFAG